MFKHLPSISAAQYFLSHEIVCWMVMEKKWKLQMCEPGLPATACYWTSSIFMASITVKDPRYTASHIVGCFQSLLPGANGKTSVFKVFQHSDSEFPILWETHPCSSYPNRALGLMMSHPTTLATLCCQRIHDLRAMHDLFSHCLSPFITELNGFPWVSSLPRNAWKWCWIFRKHWHLIDDIL